MDCRTFHKQLEDYLEGGLDFPARFGMERHAKHCFACEKDIAEAINLKQMAQELRSVGAPPDFEARLLARIHAEKARRGFWKPRSFWLYRWDRFSWRTLSAVVATIVLVAGAISFLHFEIFFNRSASKLWETTGRLATPFAGGDAGGSAADFGLPLRVRPGVADANSSLVGVPAININGAGFFGRDPWATPFAEPGDSDYVEFLVPVSGDRQLVLRLPRTIRMRYDQPSQDYFIRNVSH